MARLRDEVTVNRADGADAPAVLRDFITSLGDLVHHPLEPKIVSQALARLAGALSSDAAAFFLRNHEGLQLLCAGGGEGPGRSALETEGRDAAAQAMEDAAAVVRNGNATCLLGAPVASEGRPVGALVLARAGASFSATDTAILEAFTDVMGTSLRRERMEAQMAEQVKALERQDFRLFTINHVARVLGSILELDELLRLIPDMVSEIVTAESAVIFLVQEEESLLQVRSSKVLDPRRKPPEFQLHLSDGFHDWVRGFSGQMAPVVASDAREVRESVPAMAEEFLKHGLLLFTPMVYKDRLVGLLAVGRKYTGEPYGERDREFLSTLAPLASNAIANAQLYDLAIHDGTTGLYVSHYFRRRVMEELKRSRRYGFPVSVTMFDLDYFKQINDTYGHLTGDQVLREMGVLLKRSSRRDIDVVARYGGEEFVILLPETAQDGAVVVAERIRRSVEDFTFCGGRIRLTTSGGVSTFPDDAMTYEELLERADIQLYRAKRAGRNRIYAADIEFPLR